MSDKFTFGSAGEIQEVEFALARAGATHAEVKAMTKGGFFADVLAVIRGGAAIARILLLKPIGTVAIAPTKGVFIAREKFVVNTKWNAAVKIAYIWDEFTSWFMDKTEQPFEGSTLKYGTLSRSSVDGPIIAELGGEEKAETTLAEVFALMSAQPNGEKGALLTNGYANIFYVRDAKGVLRAVGVYWAADDCGWRVRARSVTYPNTWRGGDQVFSRNSR